MAVLALFVLVLVMHDHGMTMAGRFVTGNDVIAMGRRGGMSLGGRRRGMSQRGSQRENRSSSGQSPENGRTHDLSPCVATVRQRPLDATRQLNGHLTKHAEIVQNCRAAATDVTARPIPDHS